MIPLFLSAVFPLSQFLCHLDIISTRHIKEVFDTIGPSVLSIINTCLLMGAVPGDFKHVTVQQPFLIEPKVTKIYLVNI